MSFMPWNSAAFCGATTLPMTFARNMASLLWQNRVEVVVRARDDVHAYDFAHRTSGGGTGIHCRLHAGHIARNESGAQAAAHFLPTLELNFGGLQHGIRGAYQSGQALGFNHSNTGHVRLHFIRAISAKALREARHGDAV